MCVLQGDGLRVSEAPLIGEPIPIDTLAHASLFERPTLIARASISTATAVGAVVVSVPVTPFFSPLPLGDISDSMASFSLSVPGYVGLPYAQWRGDLRYHIEVIAATMHQGSLQVAWYPLGTSLSANPTNTLNNVIFDIADSPERVFEIGYARHVPYCSSALYAPSMPIVPAGATNGTFVVKLLTPLQTQDSSNTVTVLIWLSASPNLEFAQLRSVVPVPTFGGVQPCDLCTQVTLQMSAKDALGAEGAERVVRHSLNGSSGFYPTDAVNFPGQSVRSLRAILQKPQWSTRPLQSGGLISPVERNLWRPVTITRPQGFSFESYYLALYADAAYSLRLQFLAKNDGVIAVSVDGGLGNYDPGRWPIAGTAQRVGPYGGASAAIPYSFPAKFLPTRPTSWSADGNIGVLTQQLDGTALPFVMYRSCGPDLSVGPFIGVPTITFNPSVPVTSLFPS